MFGSKGTLFGIALVCGIAALQPQLWGQSNISTLISAPKGTPTISVRNGSINLNTGNLQMDIPLVSAPERGGGPSTMSLRYNSMFWNGLTWNNDGVGGSVITPPTGGRNWSISVDSGAAQIGNAYPVNVQTVGCGSGWYGSIQEYVIWQFVDSKGTFHTFQPGTTYTQNCSSATGVPEYPNGYGAQTASGQAPDGSGYFISVSNGNSPTIYAPDGSTYATTPNGNQAYLDSTLQGPGGPGPGSDVFPSMASECFQNTYAQPYSPKASQTCHLTYRPLNGAQSTAISYTLTFAYVPVCTGFYSGMGTVLQAYDYCGGIWALQNLTMPDGVSSYSFTYDTGTASGHYGQLLSMTLPTGGTVSYTYYPPTGLGTSFQSDIRSDIKSVADNGGTTGFARTFCAKTGSCLAPFLTATITPPAHASDPSLPGSTVQDQTTYTTSSSTSGNTVSTMLTEKDYLNGSLITTRTLDTTRIGTPAFSQTTWNETGQTDRIEYQYTTGDVVSRADEYLNGNIYGSALTQYQQDTSTIPYVSQYHMVNYPISTKILDHGGNLVAQETRTYDEYGASYCNVAPLGLSAISMLTNITGAIGHDDINFGSTRWARGNPTTITKSVSATAAVTIHNCYDTLGNVTQTVDANGNPTRFSYADNYSDTSCIATSTKTYAVPTLVTDALGRQTNTSYNSCLRQPVQIQNANDVASSRAGTQLTYDTQGRALCTSYADGGQKCSSYPSATSVQSSQLVAGTTSHTITTTLTPFGEIGSVVDLTTGAEVDQTYDNAGRLSSVSNPYSTGGSGSSIVTSYGYDGFGRTMTVIDPDTKKRTLSYLGTTTYSTDENGVRHQLAYDTLGRLSTVVDTGTSTSPISLETDYGYDSLNNLLTVNQQGTTGETARARNFTYDWLSRLVCASNPENASAACPLAATSYTAGTVGYAYDANGNLTVKTDARGTKISYGYDSLNRLTGKSYSDGTAPAAFGYDGKDATGTTLPSSYSATSNVIGRLTYASNTVNADNGFGYDAMGRVTTETYCLPVNCGNRQTVTASYDLAGNRTSITYPDTRKVQTGLSAAGQVNSVQYQTWNGTSINQPYLTATATNSYDPAGHLINATFGNGVPYAAGYDNRERMTSLTYGPTSGPAWSKQFAWTTNSNLQSQTDLITGVERQFAYDPLNRLTAAQDIFSNAAVASGSNGNTTSTTTSGSGAEEAPGVTGGLQEWTNPDDSNLLPELKAPNSSWNVTGGTTSPNTAVLAPDGTKTTLAFASTSGDGYLTGSPSDPSAYSLETMTGSVWLKSLNGSAQTVNIYLIASGAVFGVKQVQLSSSWAQYQLTAAAPDSVTAMIFQIGGGGSLASGQGYYIWNPMLEDHGIAGSSVTNVLPDSQNVAGASWVTKDVSITTNTGTAPDGTSTAATATANAGTSDNYLLDQVNNPAPFDQQQITGSIYIKAATALSTNLQIGEAVNGAYSYCGQTPIAVSTVWQRFSLTCTAQNTLSRLYLQLAGGGFVNGQSLQVWGAQMELAPTVGPYVVTGAVPATVGTTLTNILQYSQQPNGPTWGLNQFPVVANSVIAPDGSKTGSQATAVGGSGWITNDVSNVSLYSNATVTASVYLRVPSGTGAINFYLIAENPSGRVLLQQVPTSLTTTWQRFSTTAQLPNGLTRLLIQIGETETAGQVVDVWGSQIEIASHAGPYVATSALPIITGSDPTNILPNSQNLSGANWGMAAGGCVGNAATAPDGTGTAANCVSQSTSSDSYLKAYIPNPSLYDSETVTASVYLRSNNGGNQTIKLFLQNVGSQGSAAAAQQVITATPTWQRFDLTAGLQDGLTYVALQIGGAGTVSQGQGFQIWGAQFVVGSTPAPYDSSNSSTTVYATGQGGTLVPNGLNQVYSYDSFGNILQNGSFESSYTAKNQMFGYAYDAAGNLLSDGMNIMTWDAENRMATAAGATYIYDAEGNRVEKQGSSITDTVYFGGQPIARYSAGQWTDLIYGPTGLLAEVPGTPTGAPVYRVTDNLGTNVGSLLANGTFINPIDHTPFGQVLTGNTSDPYLFTGKERDTESGLDYFGARYYASNMGRFMSPDWAPGISPIPYADISDPQTLNLYSYVRNNPLSRRDADGHHQECGAQTSTTDRETGAVTVNANCHEVPDPPSMLQNIGSWFSRAGASLAAVVSRSLGSFGGPRAGKPFTPKGKQQVIQRNAEANGGKNVCENCGQPTVPAKQSEAGVSRPGNENAVDHIYPRSQGGDGDPETNGGLLCSTCNGVKSDSLPSVGEDTIVPVEPVVPIEPIIIDPIIIP